MKEWTHNRSRIKVVSMIGKLSLKTPYKFRLSVGIFVAAMLFMTSIFGMINVKADGGMISFKDFDVYEPGQNAIIAWNGQTERMILSVDVYSEQSTKALHMVPFPSKPTAELGDAEAFEELNELIDKYRPKYDSKFGSGRDSLGPPTSNIHIVSSELIGPHDLTTVWISDPSDFTTWVNEFLASKGFEDKELPEELDDVIGHYTLSGIRYFVFDVIELEPDKRSVDPIIYTFETDYLFFPLEISSIIEGSTKITLALITPSNLPINYMPLQEMGFRKNFDKILSSFEIEPVNEDISEMFIGRVRLTLNYGRFDLDKLTDDVMIGKLFNVNWLYTEPAGFYHKKITDLNKDGKKEITLCDSEKIYILDAESGDLLHEASFAPLNDIYDDLTYRELTDINKDGFLDIITFSNNNDLLIINGKDGSITWQVKIESKYNIRNHQFHVKYIDDGNSSKIIIYTRFEVWALNDSDGEELWNWTIKCLEGVHIWGLDIGDVNGDRYSDLVMSTDHGDIFTLNGKTGTIIWYNSPPFDMKYFKVGDISKEPGDEILLVSKHNITSWNGQTGSVIWESEQLHGEFDRINGIYLDDINDDNISEILINHRPYISILNGEDGSSWWEDKDSIELEGIERFGSIEIIDLEHDGMYEIIVGWSDYLYVVDMESTAEIWNFTTGDHISSYEFADIDSDDLHELVFITEKRLYVVEYIQDEQIEDAISEDNKKIVIRSILSVVIISVIIMVALLVTIKKRGSHDRIDVKNNKPYPVKDANNINYKSYLRLDR
jgi:outer membrane protein assembly factor BamB